MPIFAFLENKKYPKQNITQRRETTPSPQTTAKNPLDNSSSILYNKNKKNSMVGTSFRDYSKIWKDNNRDALKYAGKTAYADDRYRTATVNGKAYQVEYPIATKDSLQPRMLNDSEVKLASADYDAKLTSSKSGADYEKNSRKVQR